MEIWYVFLRSTGEYMGSGTPHYDDEVYGSTRIPVPEYDFETETPYWRNLTWILIPNTQPEA